MSFGKLNSNLALCKSIYMYVDIKVSDVECSYKPLQCKPCYEFITLYNLPYTTNRKCICVYIHPYTCIKYVYSNEH